MDDRFQRTTGILSPSNIQRLSQTHVLIAGVGGAGGQTAIDLARLGFGYITLADFDVYERHNMNRQVGCFESTLGKRKIDVVARMCSDINPNLQLQKIREGVNEDNCHSLIIKSEFPAPEFVIEVIDLSDVPAKISLHKACRNNGTIIMTGLMLGFGASLLVFDDSAPPYDQLFVDKKGQIDFPKIVPRLGSYVIQEFMDKCFKGQGHAPTCAIGATMASALMTTEIIKAITLGTETLTKWPDYTYIDLIDRVFLKDTLKSVP